MKKKSIDIVLPAYNEEKNLKLLIPKIYNNLLFFKNKFKFRVVIVNDGSTDGTFNLIKYYQKKYFNLKIINIKKKSGQTNAYLSYLNKYTSDYFIRIDSDNQDNPNYLKKIFVYFSQNYNLVIAKRENFKNSTTNIILGFLFNKIFEIYFNKKVDTFTASMVGFKRKYINIKNLKKNDHRYLILISIFNGANKIKVFKSVHRARKFGKSNYNALKKFIFALPELTLFLYRLKSDYYKIKNKELKNLAK